MRPRSDRRMRRSAGGACTARSNIVVCDSSRPWEKPHTPQRYLNGFVPASDLPSTENANAVLVVNVAPGLTTVVGQPF